MTSLLPLWPPPSTLLPVILEDSLKERHPKIPYPNTICSQAQRNESWRAGVDDGTNDLRDLSEVAHQEAFRSIYQREPQTVCYTEGTVLWPAQNNYSGPQLADEPQGPLRLLFNCFYAGYDNGDTRFRYSDPAGKNSYLTLGHLVFRVSDFGGRIYFNGQATSH